MVSTVSSYHLPAVSQAQAWVSGEATAQWLLTFGAPGVER